MKQTKNKLNEKEATEVSGGYIIWDSNGGKFKDDFDRKYNSYCDFCSKKMEGRGSISVKGGREACIDCYKKLSEINKNVDKINFYDHKFK